MVNYHKVVDKIHQHYVGRNFSFITPARVAGDKNSLDFYYKSTFTKRFTDIDTTKIKRELKIYYNCRNVRFYRIITTG
jgi:hypothetical protein